MDEAGERFGAPPNPAVSVVWLAGHALLRPALV